MRPIADKEKFVMLRAEGKSITAVCKELELSHNAGAAWDKELKDVIVEYKQRQLEELYETYFVTKEARIKKIGEVLKKIDKAIGELDFNKIPPEKLLEYKLKYTQMLKDEYVPISKGTEIKADADPKDIMSSLADLLTRVRNGEVSMEQANRESVVLGNMLKAYENTMLKDQLEHLKAIIESSGGVKK